MAMIMNYYQYPVMNMTYNGETITTNYPMPYSLSYSCPVSGTFTNNEKQVAMLIRQCGSFAGSNYGILGNCSTATWYWNIDDAFSQMFYSSGGTWGSLSSQYDNVKSDLKNYHPVLFYGSTGSLNFSDYHYWVADGYYETTYEYESTYIGEDGEEHCTCNLYSVVKIGFCWGGCTGNGNGFYYADFSFEKDPNDPYDTSLKALTGIRP